MPKSDKHRYDILYCTSNFKYTYGIVYNAPHGKTDQ